jgi:hypothetical protein
MTRAPQSRAISRVASAERESTTTTSSAQATDSHASRMFSASLKVMMVAEIFKAFRRRPLKYASENTDAAAGASTSETVGLPPHPSNAEIKNDREGPPLPGRFKFRSGRR